MGTKAEELAKLARGEGCLAKAADDELIFILRSQDKMMPGILHVWVDEVKAWLGPGHPKVLEAQELLDRVNLWAATHPTKMPD